MASAGLEGDAHPLIAEASAAVAEITKLRAELQATKSQLALVRRENQSLRGAANGQPKVELPEESSLMLRRLGVDELAVLIAALPAERRH